MHDPFGVHVFEPLQEALDDFADLAVREGDLAAQLLEELVPPEELEAHVDGVFGFVDLVELHEVRVVEGPHDLDFVDETFLEGGVGGRQVPFPFPRCRPSAWRRL